MDWLNVFYFNVFGNMWSYRKGIIESRNGGGDGLKFLDNIKFV